MGIKWGLLKIELTKDVSEITKAYRAELRKTNPEDDPEGFKELRAAYEAALEYAKEDEEENDNKTGIDRWIDSVEHIYKDFEKRIDENCWKDLLADSVCESIEDGETAFERLMTFLMDNFRLPQNVWKVLDARFDLQARHDELCEKWPSEFIDYVIVPGINNKELIPYYMFDPGKNADECDQLISLYCNAFSESDDNALDIIKKADGLSESHPYIKALKNYLIVQAKGAESEKALADQEKLYHSFLEDNCIRDRYIATLILNKDYAKCEALCKEIRAENKGDFSIISSLSEALVQQNKLEEAYDVIHDEVKLKEQPIEILAVLQKMKSDISDKILEDISVVKNDNNNEYYKNLVWYALSSSGDNYDKAREFAKHLDADTMDQFDYNYLMSALYSESKEYDKVVEYNEKIIEYIKSNKAVECMDETERKNRLVNIYCNQLMNYSLMKDMTQTEKYINLAISEFPDNDTIQICVIKAKMKMEDYEGARHVSEMMLKTNGLNIIGWYYLSVSAYGMWDDKTAFEAGFKLAQLLPNQPEGYILQLRVLARNNALERFEETIAYIKDIQIEIKDELLYFDTLLHEKDNLQKAFDEYLVLYDKIRDNLDSEDPFYIDELKSKLLECFDEKIKMLRRQGEGVEAAKECKRCCELLNVKLEDSPILSIYKQFSMWEEADAVIDLVIDSNDPESLYQRALLELSKGNGPKAQELYSRIITEYGLDKNDILHTHFMRLKGDLKAQKDFWKKKIKVLKKNDGDTLNAYVHLAFVSKCLGERLASAKYAKLAIKMSERRIANGTDYEPLYRNNLMLMDAILGNYELAETELIKLRNCQLCGMCEYSECKDSYIFEGLIEVLKHNYDKAREIFQYGQKRWPDDVDFYCYECEINSMGV